MINTESFDHLLTYLLGMEKEAGLSYSRSVFSIDPINKMDYAALKEYRDERAFLATVKLAPDRVSGILARGLKD